MRRTISKKLQIKEERLITVTGQIAVIELCHRWLNRNRCAVFDFYFTPAEQSAKKLHVFVSGGLRERCQRELQNGGKATLSLQKFSHGIKGEYELVDFACLDMSASG